MGHFSVVCKSTTVNTTKNDHLRYVEKSDSSDDDFLLTINSNLSLSGNQPIPILLENTVTPVLIDSGSTINVID